MSHLLFLGACLVVACMLSSSNSGAAPLSVYNPPTSLQTSSPRLDMAGTWDFRFDPDGVGEAQKWYEQSSDAGWQNISVPGSYNILFEDKLWYQGKAWYRRDFDLPADWTQKGNKVIFHCLGALMRKKAWLNGSYLGEHLYPYTAFQYDLTPYLKKGSNTLVIEIDNTILDRAIPDKEWDGWWFYGGLNRDCFLELRPDESISNLWMDARMYGDAWECTITARVAESDGKDVLFTVSRLDGSEVASVESVAGDGWAVAKLTVSEVDAWTPNNPDLYRLTAQLGKNGHKVSIRTAFREIRVDGTKILLNGQKLLIKGTNRHEDYMGHGNTVPFERTLQDMRDIKELGCNFLRTAHYTQHPYVFDLCDELGLLVWTEIPAWKTSPESLSDPQVFEIYGKGQFNEIIEQYRRFPCVVMWSVGNEYPSEKEPVKQYIEKMTAYIKSLDPTRLVTFASDRRERDISFGTVDVISLNEYYGWYYYSIYDVGPMLDKVHELWPDKPIVVSEFGAGTPRGWHTKNPYRIFGRDYSEEYQIKYLETHIGQIFDSRRVEAYCAGGITWVYNDFRDPHRIGGEHPKEWDYVNLKGVVNMPRERKSGFDFLKGIFNYIPPEGMPVGNRKLATAPKAP